MDTSQDSMTVGELVTLYLQHTQTVGTHSAEARTQRVATLGRFRREFGTKRVIECQAYLLSDWIEGTPEWKSTATRKARANQVNAVFNWAYRQGRIDRNPFRSVNYAEAEPRQPMLDADLEKIVAKSNPPYVRVLRFLRFTGCRLGDLCGLVWEDVDLSKGMAVVRNHKSRRKTHKPKVLVLTMECVLFLSAMRCDCKTGIVFKSGRGTPWNRRTLGQQLRRLKARYDLPIGATLHGIRHQVGTEAVRAGVPLKHVSLALGHQSTAITERFYVHLAGEVEALRSALAATRPAYKREASLIVEPTHHNHKEN